MSIDRIPLSTALMLETKSYCFHTDTPYSSLARFDDRYLQSQKAGQQ